ncbi:hypothetical protein SAMN05216421_2960 [Halopseudomonas xinjiangensis]|uniref:Uncharacterized protein n=1 Tax=Halopseudomonas xinjiangensis TaxID=487184 RepID=A0A1H1XUQ3_9GAMM|nr:hypothetical protein SAMN05216421_2960 [Halopseudomonas xinjiangensis]
MQRSVVKLAQSLAGQDDDVKIPQRRAVRSEGFASDAFDLVTVYRAPDTFLGNDQTKPGVLTRIGASQQQQAWA